MTRSHVRWLLGELPELVRRGVLTDAAAAGLRNHYRPALAADHRLPLLVFGVLGVGLIAAGIVLLLAHNWEDLPRPVRTAIALGMLLVAQVACAETLWRRRDAVWVEATATLLAGAVAASMALVEQTYHVADTATAFLLRWLLLALPVAYVTGSRVVAAASLGAVSVWCLADAASHGPWFWLLAGSLVPFVSWSLVRPAGSWRDDLLGWTGSVALAAGAVSLLAEGAGLVAFSAVLAGLSAAGLTAPSPRRMPLLLAGAAGTVVTALVLGFRGPWNQIDAWLPAAAGTGLLALGLALVLTGAASVAVLRRAPSAAGLLLAGFPAVVAAGVALRLAVGGWAPAALGNLYMLALGIAATASGLSQGRLGATNGGLTVLAALFVARFLDADLSFVLRGVGFIAIGAGFLGVNWRLLASRRREAL